MNILLVDDDQLVRDSFEVIFSTDEFHVVGKMKNGKEAVDFVRNHNVDVVLMDINMPEMNGIDATSVIKREFPDVKVIMLTTFRDFRHVHQSLHAGANGYILKTDDVNIQVDTIKSVYEGKAIISEEALKQFTESKRDELLTERENSCMELVAHGYNNKEIAQRLYIGEGTVRNVISLILDKLELRDRTQIAIYYWQSKQDE